MEAVQPLHTIATRVVDEVEHFAKIEPQTRIEEIEGWLSAYRNGWVSYDRAHVIALQAERTTLINNASAAA